MLAVVALLAAYTGFASAKWNTESSVRLAQASAARTEANRAALNAQNLKNFDSTTFNTWFTSYIAGNPTAESVAVRRFRPAFKVAFDAWLATDPFTNAKAPPGPTYMAQYKQPELVASAALDSEGDGGLHTRRPGRIQRRQLHPRHHLPRDDPLPHRDQRAFPLPSDPPGARDTQRDHDDCRHRRDRHLTSHPMTTDLS